MLQETVYEKKSIGLLKTGFYYIRTTRAVWCRVQVVARSRRYIRILYLATERRRVRNGWWKTHRVLRTEELPIWAIVEARRYVL